MIKIKIKINQDTKFLTFFFNQYKAINFNDRKVRKSNFYKNKKIYRIEGIDINNVLVSRKKNNTKQKIYLNTLLDIMIMILLDHYV